MDKIIEQLHHMEVDANRHLESVQEEKLALRQDYDQKKADYKKQAQDKYDEELARVQARNQDLREQRTQDLQASYNRQMEQIKQLVDHDQDSYLKDFFNQLQALGVTGDD
ncbi:MULTISPECIES: hypothetical protein [Aerococcus]|uniref:hypothetical protein n=1 Tax=Aerococcus TaxID=1375 RepID=UPI0018A71273|nr:MULTISPECIES: hypothetical protein [Aerococcus]MCY3036104.1 hypothetical protein [Aerococcus sp. Group 2]MCY3040060.1 hypothetical protein [Aerococcus sp. Group 2]MCY3040774.1 hypothetical protein [Aerococcus sp. Group 2]MCY3042766.1 hypothetical protein [Aerococcus sp. Group 2]MDK6520911.1 hypothetical protein [Aerococcus urinae]